MPYKVGQKVVCLKGISKPGLVYWSNSMAWDVGKIGILVRSNGASLWRMTVRGEDGGYWWHEEWIRHVGCCCGIKNCITKHKDQK